MNLDDGGSFDTPAHHIVLRDITIPSAGSGGDNDCVEMSGVDDFWILDSDVAGWCELPIGQTRQRSGLTAFAHGEWICPPSSHRFR